MKLKSVFLPPGVQARLFQKLGSCPRVLPPAAVAKIDALWLKRNQCAEEEIDAIDAEMEVIATENAAPGANVSAAINAKKAGMQRAMDRRDDRSAE